MEEVDRQRNQRVVPQTTRTGSMASLIQQEMSTAAGEGAGSSSAHAALPRSNTGLDTQRILDQLDPLTREAHIGLVKHGDRMYSYMSHCCSPFVGLEEDKHRKKHPKRRKKHARAGRPSKRAAAPAEKRKALRHKHKSKGKRKSDRPSA